MLMTRYSFGAVAFALLASCSGGSHRATPRLPTPPPPLTSTTTVPRAPAAHQAAVHAAGGVDIDSSGLLSIPAGCPVDRPTIRVDETTSVVTVYLTYAHPTTLFCDKIAGARLRSPLGTRRIVDGVTGKLLYIGVDKRCDPIRYGRRCDGVASARVA
jgi:hypothetical protein